MRLALLHLTHYLTKVLARTRAKPLLLLMLALLLASPSSLFAQAGAIEGEWQAYGGDIGSTKYTPLDQIDASNIDQLQIAWRRPALDSFYTDLNPNQRFSNNYVAAAIIHDGTAYIPNGVGLVEAFNPGTGETLWVQQPPGGLEGLPGAPTRGAAYWSDGANTRIFSQRGTYLYALLTLAIKVGLICS
jgi:glucose dehydrogenase